MFNFDRKKRRNALANIFETAEDIKIKNTRDAVESMVLVTKEKGEPVLYIGNAGVFSVSYSKDTDSYKAINYETNELALEFTDAEQLIDFLKDEKLNKGLQNE